jgi:hypothetical protein
MAVSLMGAARIRKFIHSTSAVSGWPSCLLRAVSTAMAAAPS